MIKRGDDAFLEKADECLAGAESEYLAGRYNNCANRCYYAVFQAAIWALAQAGIRPAGRDGEWSHEFVISQFNGQLINRRKQIRRVFVHFWEHNRELRRMADYQHRRVADVAARRAFRRAQDFLKAVHSGGSMR